LEEKIIENLNKGKVLIVYGARQVGKTTSVRSVMEKYNDCVYLNGDFVDDQDKLAEPSRAMVNQFKDHELLVIDEAQKVSDIGIKLKVIRDALPELKIIVTGSSAFDISSRVSEPLTGRSFSYVMYPVSVAEADSARLFGLEDALVYGSYPGVIIADGEPAKEELIKNIASNYLFKDVLNIEYIKNPKSLEHLLKALSDQLGNEVSVNELSNTLDIDSKTISHYLDILEKLYVIFPLRPYFSNVRKSLTKKSKYYFYDLGIRNAVAGDWSALTSRDDVGALWENFCIVERMKMNAARSEFPSYYFWRSYKGEEIDLIEVRNGKLIGFECKWHDAHVSPLIKKIYAEDLGGSGALEVITKDNFHDYLS
jgi:predicted AAA+ superfamily ATPase